MNSHNNSVRLQRIANTLNLKSNNSSTMLDISMSETFKLPALHAINKSIKYNDLSFATSRDLNKLRKEPEQPSDIEELSAHHSLLAMRKKYDFMNKTREERQRSIDRLQAQRDKLDSERQRFLGEKDDGSKRVQLLQHALDDMKLQVEEAETEKKVMVNMTDRLKYDKVVYDLRKYNLDKELTSIGKQKHIIIKESEGKREQEDRTRKIFNKLLEHLEGEQHERELHLRSMEGMLEEKVGLNTTNEIRMSQMREIAENTLQDKDPKEKNWHKVYLCHRFVERVLRDKMTREMIKFNIVEVAFKNIKTSTGVNNAEMLVKKFLNKENAYGELLGKIAENERTILDLKAETDALNLERRKLENEQQHLNANRIQNKDLSKQEKEMQAMSEKSLRCHTYQEKLNTWVANIIKKFQRLQNVQSEGKEDTNIIEQFKTYLAIMEKNLEQLKQYEDKSLSTEVAGSETNCRVSLHERDNPEEKPHKNKQPLNQQEDYVDTQWQEAIRNNSKFMVEVKKKHEEAKKAMIQAEPKKRQPVPEKPKPPPVEA